MEQEKKTFTNIAQLCRAKGLDPKLVRAASKLGLPGFNLNRTINWELLEPALKQAESELKKHVKDRSLDEIKKDNLIKDGRIKDLEIQKREGSYIDPSDWYQFFSDFGIELSTLIKASRKNLMEQCRGYETVIDNAFLDL